MSQLFLLRERNSTHEAKAVLLFRVTTAFATFNMRFGELPRSAWFVGRTRPSLAAYFLPTGCAAVPRVVSLRIEQIPANPALVLLKSLQRGFSWHGEPSGVPLGNYTTPNVTDNFPQVNRIGDSLLKALGCV